MKKLLLIILLLVVISAVVYADVNYMQGYLLNSQTINNLASHGAGYWFDGVDDYVHITDNFNTAKTLSFWVNADTWIDIVISKAAVGTEGYIQYTGGLKFYAPTNTLTVNWGTLSTDEWYHCTLVVTGTQHLAYLNGALVNSTTTALDLFTGGDNFYIGSLGGTGYYFNGSISDVRIYNRALSSTEVKDLYSNGNIPYADIGADNTEFFTTAIDRTFTGGGTHWVNVDIGFIFNETTDLSLESDAIGQYCKIIFTDIGTVLENGKQYRLTYDYAQTTAGYEFKLVGTATQTLGDAVVGTNQTIEFTAEEDYTANEYLGIFSKTDVDAAGDFDNFSLIQIGCVGNWNSSGVGHNQWIDAGGNELNGEVSGAIPINLLVDDTQVLVLKDITGETTKTNWLPKGYAIKSVIFKHTGDIITDFNIGFTDNGGEIVANINIDVNEIGNFAVLQQVADLDNADTFYISATVWNGSIDLYITIERIVIK